MDKRKELLNTVLKTVKRDIEKIETDLDKEIEDDFEKLFSILDYIESKLLVMDRQGQKSQSILQ
jgi:hypothetical protein